MFDSQDLNSSSAYVTSTCADDPDMSEMIPVFLETLPSIKTTMLEFAKVCDFEGVRREAHRLKGTAGAFGFGGLSELAADLEDTCKTRIRDSAAILNHLDRVIAYVERVR